MKKNWLLINIALLVLAIISVNMLVALPKQTQKEADKTREAIKGADPDTIKSHQKTKTNTKKSLSGKQTPERTSHQLGGLKRGALDAIWKASLFNALRTEEIEKLPDGDADSTEELPAPPNFELIGILTANDAKVAIIELKVATSANRGGRMGPGGRGGNMPRTPNSPASSATSNQSFEPTFATVHVNDKLPGTDYRVVSIDAEKRAVTIAKDGLNYKLAINKNSTTAQQRNDAQNSYETQQKSKNTATQAKTTQPTPNSPQQPAAAQQPSGQQGTPGQPGQPGQQMPPNFQRGPGAQNGQSGFNNGNGFRPDRQRFQNGTQPGQVNPGEGRRQSPRQ